MTAIDTAQISFSADFSATLMRASELAVSRGADEAGLEDLLIALCDDPDAGAVLRASPVRIDDLKADVLGRMSGKSSDSAVTGGDGASNEARRILEAASTAAKTSKIYDIDGAIVIAAIVGDARNVGAEILKAHGLTFDVAIRALQSARFSAKSGPAEATAASRRLDDTPSHAESDKSVSPSPAAPEPVKVAAPEGNGLSPGQPGPAPLSDDAVGTKKTVGDTKGAATTGDVSVLSKSEAEPIERQIGVAQMPAQTQPIQNLPFPQATPAPPSILPPDPAPFPILPFPAFPSLSMPVNPATPYPVQTTFGPAETPKEGIGYGLSHVRSSPIPGHASDSSEVLANIVRTKPAPNGIQPPPIPPSITVPSALNPSASAAAYYANTSRQQNLSQEPQFPYAHAPQLETPAKRSTSGKGKATKVEPGQIAENIPRSMRVGRTKRAEVRINKAWMVEGGGSASQAPLIVAAVVRIRAPEGGFFIEPMSPETQWIENKKGYAPDEFTSWRFLVTPQSRGWARLQILVSTRSVAADGVAAATNFPDRVVEVKVRRSIRRFLLRWLGWIVAAALGGAIATFGAKGIEVMNIYMR